MTDPTYTALDVLRAAQPGGLTVDDMMIRQVADLMADRSASSEACLIEWKFELLAEGGVSAADADYPTCEAVEGDFDLSTLPWVDHTPPSNETVVLASYSDTSKHSTTIPSGFGVARILIETQTPTDTPDDEAVLTVNLGDVSNPSTSAVNLQLDAPDLIDTGSFPFTVGCYGTTAGITLSAATDATSGSWLVHVIMWIYQHTPTTYLNTIID